jgi:hypothetical protein
MTAVITVEVALLQFWHWYPTQEEAIKATAGITTRTRLAPGVKQLFSVWQRFFC